MTIKRAVVLIGIQNATDLPPLKAVWDGVQQMKDWALAQGVEAELIKSFTDQSDTDGNAPVVAPHHVEDHILTLVQRGDIEQLIIYYAGHGINVGYSEFWLFSQAMLNGNRAVNVRGSMEIASRGAIPHVIFISDTCRNAAEGIAAQAKRGSVIFPATGVSNSERCVDVFWATRIGEVSLEFRTPDEAADRYEAVYTEALVEALNGLHPPAIVKEGNSQFVRPRPLHKFLKTDLPIRVIMRPNAHGRSQEPDARITSDDDAWLSRITHPVTDDGIETFAPPGTQPTANDLLHMEAAKFFHDLPEVVSRAAVTGDRAKMIAALSHRSTMGNQIGRADLDVFTARADRFNRDILRAAEPTGPAHFETGSGFKLRGAMVAECLAHQAAIDILGGQQLIRVAAPERSAVSTLLRLSDGRGILLPAISGFLCTLTFDEGSLIDAAYEPCDTNERWASFVDRADELRQLRAVVSSSTRMGQFTLDAEQAEELERRMQFGKGLDPSLALYAAHAYLELGQRKRIRQMADFMRSDLGLVLFDIELLTGEMPNDPTAPQHGIFPFLPMLAQTWPLLSVYRDQLQLPAGLHLDDIWQHVLPNSLWTLFNQDGVELLSETIQRGVVR